MITWSVIHLLLLIRSKEIKVVNSIAVRNDEIYCEAIEVASVWLIGKYTEAVAELRPIVKQKQKSFDYAVLKIIVGLICYAIVLVIEKGL